MAHAKTCFWAILLVSVGVIARCLPHAPNFSPILAIALFSAVVLPRPVALVVPLLSMFFGDLAIGFHDTMWAVYLSLLPMVAMGWLLPRFEARVKTWLSWGVAGFLAAGFFFLTTNFAVWLDSPTYAQNWNGLVECYVMALPFFHASVLSTWVYLTGFAAVAQLHPALRPAPQTHSR